MEDWFICGVSAAVLWGVYIVLLKVATARLHASVAFWVMTVGIVVTSITALGGYMWKGGSVTFPMPGTIWALLAGLSWGIGMGFVIHALSFPPSVVSRLTPLYNVNTLVAVIWGIAWFEEIPGATIWAWFLFGLGVVLIMGGGYLVAKGPSATNQDSASENTSAIPHVGRRKILGFEEWVPYGAAAIFFWGTYIVFLKRAVSPEYCAMEPFTAFLVMVLVILVISLIAFPVLRRSRGNFSKSGFLTVSLWPFIKLKETRLSSLWARVIALISGIFWGVAMLLVIHALSDLQAPVARLTPLYNINTAIAVLIGLGVLAEGRNLKLKRVVRFIGLGAACVMLGAWLVSI